MLVGVEQTRRMIDGVLQYVAMHPDLVVRDFSFPKDDGTVPESPPPWLGRADGVVAGLRRFPNLVPWLRAGGVPVVNMGADVRDEELVSVITDPKSVAKLAVDHFAYILRRNIAYIGYRHAEGSRDRLAAVKEALSKRKLLLAAYETDARYTGTYKDFASLKDVEPEVLRILRDTAKPMAVLALNDKWAVTLCRIARDLGLDIPGDVAVLGVEDWDIARFANPAVSSIRIHNEQMGYEAARLVHAMIRGERLTRRYLQVPAHEVVPRESTVGRVHSATIDIDKAVRYIRARACDGIRVEDVANHVQVSVRKLEMRFAEVTGRTVGEEVRNVRLERVKHLLETTELPMSRVAHLVGLSSPAALTSFLRRWAEITPARYRSLHRK
jgi:LacI family transcriptional regulator